jgi:hypothetical protein
LLFGEPGLEESFLSAVLSTGEVCLAKAGEHAQETGIEFGFLVQLVQETGGIEVDNEFAELGGGDLAGGFVQTCSSVSAQEIHGHFLFGLDQLETLLLSQPILVPAGSPGGEILHYEVLTVVAEFVDDFSVG